jgi:peptide subunit release factor 1 (eRF1)
VKVADIDSGDDGKLVSDDEKAAGSTRRKPRQGHGGGSTSEFVCEVLVPVRRLDCAAYVCDKRFHVHEFAEYFSVISDQKHGLVFGSGERVDFYAESGGRIELLKSVSVCRQKAQKKGGQSAARFGRIRDNQVAAFAKLAAETCNALFLDSNAQPNILSLSFGGTGGQVAGIYALAAKSPHLNKALAALVVAVNPAADAAQLSKSTAAARTKMIGMSQDRAVTEFLDHIRKETGRAVYGVQQLLQHAHNLETVVLMPDAKSDPTWKPLLAALHSKTRVVVSSHTSLVQYGGLVAIAFFPIHEL